MCKLLFCKGFVKLVVKSLFLLPMHTRALEQDAPLKISQCVYALLNVSRFGKICQMTVMYQCPFMEPNSEKIEHITHWPLVKFWPRILHVITLSFPMITFFPIIFWHFLYWKVDSFAAGRKWGKRQKGLICNRGPRPESNDGHCSYCIWYVP